MSPNAVCQEVTGSYLSLLSFAKQTGHLIHNATAPELSSTQVVCL